MPRNSTLLASRTSLVFFTETETLIDHGAHLESDMIQSEQFELAVPIPTHKTNRWRYRNHTQPPIPNGSEYTITASPPTWDHYTQSGFVNKGQRDYYTQHIGGKTSQQLKAQTYRRLCENFILLVCFLTFATFVVTSIITAARGGGATDPATATPAVVEQTVPQNPTFEPVEAKPPTPEVQSPILGEINGQ